MSMPVSWRAIVAATIVCWSPWLAAAQSTGRLIVRVSGPDGLPAADAQVTVEGYSVAATPLSDAGTFVVDGLSAGRHVVVVRSGDALAEGRAAVAVKPDATTEVHVALQLVFSEEVVVSESRAGQLRREIPASVAAVTGEELELAKPAHPSEVLGQVPGVWVGITGGEGHQTAIRQPLTTNPVYLYLEDGVPTRSTGFFNHNALYEINVPSAEGVEITRGPGSALYGSDAIGGVVNVITRSALESSGVSASLEGGGDGWRRALGDANWSNGAHGLRATLNVTGADGWRRATGYDRQSATVRWDWLRGSALTKTLVAVNRIDQETAGSSVLPEIDYLFDPSANLTPISFRDVTAARVSVDHQRMVGSAVLSLIPYYRHDTMELLPNWALTFDPTVYTTRNHSLGVLAKLQRDVEVWRTSIVAGVDADWSPGERVEDMVIAATTPSGLPSQRLVFSSYAPGPRIYDYAVTFASVSPYVHTEFSPWPEVRFSAGLRADYMRYDYDDRLTTPDTARHRRPPDGTRAFTHVSPKLGLTYQLSGTTSLFASYRHAFRAPSEGQLFRQGSARNTIDLRPVRADNLEAGVRVALRRGISFDVSVYRLDKHDDVLNYRDPVDGLTTALNAGRTRHRGVEAGAEWSSGLWGVRAAYAYARHTYEEWVVDPASGIDLSGFEQEGAPRHLGSASLRLTPAARVAGAVEMFVLGPYWMDANNTARYGGHALVNLRGHVDLLRGVRAYARVLNVLDRHYAESASYTLSRGRELAPGRPRTLFVGIDLDWRK